MTLHNWKLWCTGEVVRHERRNKNEKIHKSHNKKPYFNSLPVLSPSIIKAFGYFLGHSVTDWYTDVFMCKDKTSLENFCIS